MEARCQCGSVTFKTPLPQPLALYICHCDACRRQTGSAFGTSAIFPRFELPDTDLLSVYRYGEIAIRSEGLAMTNCYLVDLQHRGINSTGTFLKSSQHDWAAYYCWNSYFCRKCGTRLIHSTPVSDKEISLARTLLF